MADRIKERLDQDWAEFLDGLNQTYEEAYQKLLRDAAKLGKIERAVITNVVWPEDGAIRIGLGAIVERGREHGDR